MNEEPGSWCLGDWSTPGEITIPKELVNTFYYCYCAQLMDWISQVLKIHDDKTDYGKLFDSVAKGFNKRFFDNDKGVYSIGKQGCNVFPLALGIVPDESRDEVIGHELHTILEDNGGHLDTGMYATPLLFEMLTLNGFVDTAWTMINKRTYPSYGFMIENGATTIWENWEKEVGSRNHPMLGSIIAWFYKYLAGIKADRFYPGFERFSITPTLFEGLTFVKASMKTMKGTIKVEWKRDADSFTLKAVIPAGSTADIYLPAGSPNIVVTESNKTIWENGVVKSLLPGISRCLKNNENIMIEAMSGTYLFCAKHNG
jgi:alpha-L-rhamnosidase